MLFLAHTYIQVCAHLYNTGVCTPVYMCVQHTRITRSVSGYFMGAQPSAHSNAHARSIRVDYSEYRIGMKKLNL